MADREDFDDLLGGLDQPAVPRADFAETLRARLLAELARPASTGDEPIMQTSPIPTGTPPRSFNPPRRPHWLMTAFEIAAALVLLVGFWQVADRFFGSPDLGPGGDQANQPAVTLPAPTLQPAITAPSPAASPTAVVASAMAGGDPGRTGQQFGPAPSGRLQAHLVETGNTESKYGTFASVALGDTLYRVAPIAIGGNADGGSRAENHLEARDITTGALKWSVTFDLAGNPAVGSPAVAGGRVFVFAPQPGTSKWSLEAYDAGNGHLLWEAPLPAWGLGLTGTASPVVLNGVVYAAGPNGVAVALDAKTGAQVWQSTAFQTSDIIMEQSEPGIALQRIGQFAVADGRLYLFNAHGDLGALNLNDGSLTWSFNYAERYGPVTSLQLVAVDQQVIVAAHAVDAPSNATMTTRLDAFAGATGDREWTTPLHAGFDGVSSMAIAADKVVVALSVDLLGTPVADANNIEAYNLNDGSAAWSWRWPNGGDQRSRPIIAVVGANVYFTGRAGVVSIDAETGNGAVVSDPISFTAQNIQFTVSNSTPVIADGVIVLDLGATSGQLAILSSSGAATPIATP